MGKLFRGIAKALDRSVGGHKHRTSDALRQGDQVRAQADAVNNAMLAHTAQLTKSVTQHQEVQRAALKTTQDKVAQTQMRARRGRTGNVFGTTFVGDNVLNPRLG